MDKLDCTVRLLTPAFLGDAEQKGVWRSPPFKALLRQWWRVAAAKEHGYRYEALREAEGRLFGHAWLSHHEHGHEKSWAAQSRVRLRLDHWEAGKLTQWGNDPKVKHPEVEKTPVIGAHLYLGYGPLTFAKGTSLKNACAVDAGETARLRLGLAAEHRETLMATLQLIHWFGVIGGRSRNGWGSLVLMHERILNHDQLLNGQSLGRLEKLIRPLGECLAEEWPHAIGRDERAPLLWKTKTSFVDWSEAMKTLAQVKIDFRTELPFNGPAGGLFPRHLLAYPVTHHSVRSWGNQGRLANQLRFKVMQQADGRFVGLAFHLPCALPRDLLGKLDRSDQARLTPAHQAQVWHQVHGVLDQQMTRIQGGR